MLNRGSQVIGIILIILIFLSTVGCLFDDESKPDDKRKGFDADDLSSTVPQVLDLNDQLIEPKPIINTSIRKSASNVVAIWYFEKNTVYQDYGGVITFSIKNERASEIYIYQIGIELGWQPFKSSNDDRGVSTKVGKYIDLGTEEYVGMLYFPGPKNTGEYEYHINFSVCIVNETGKWIDYGNQEATPKSMTISELSSTSEYSEHYNKAQYYDKINGLVDPTDDEVINISREQARNFSGPFNIFQACALFDYVNSNIKYFSDPSSTENYWCTPAQTLKFGGDCEDHSILLASMIISLGGAVQMYMTDSHAFLGLYIGNRSNIDEILVGIRDYYHTDLNIFWFEDDLGCWLIVDSIGSVHLGGLPLGGVPVINNDGSNSNYQTQGLSQWSWGFTGTENLYIIDIIPK